MSKTVLNNNDTALAFRTALNANFTELYNSLSATATITVKTASFALTVADSGTVIRCNSASPITVTVPAALGVGYQVSLIQSGAGQVTLSPASGVTLASSSGFTKTRTQHSILSLLETVLDNVNVSGDGA